MLKAFFLVLLSLFVISFFAFFSDSYSLSSLQVVFFLSKYNGTIRILAQCSVVLVVMVMFPCRVFVEKCVNLLQDGNCTCTRTGTLEVFNQEKGGGRNHLT